MNDAEHNLPLAQLDQERKKVLAKIIEEYRLKIQILEIEMADGWLQEQCKH